MLHQQGGIDTTRTRFGRSTIESRASQTVQATYFLNCRKMTTTIKENGGILSIFKLLDYLIIIHKLNQLGGGDPEFHTLHGKRKLTRGGVN